MNRNNLGEKFSDALKAVLPILVIVLALSFTIIPVPSGIMMSFIVSGVPVVAGMMLFTTGAETAMGPMGGAIGAAVTKTRKVPLVIILCLLLGFMITISEPDLQVLAGQVGSIPGNVLVVSVSVGVGLFLAFAVMRMLLGISLSFLLVVCYAAVFIFALFCPADFLAVAFDSGGVTTGPMTVPFIMAFGIGISAVRNDKNASDDSFGLVSLCSVGPIIAVMLLGVFFKPGNADYSNETVSSFVSSLDFATHFAGSFPKYLLEMLISLAPIAVFYAIFEIFFLRQDRKRLARILVGIAYTYVGLVLFLAGVGTGFMPMGNYLGHELASMNYSFLIIPVGMVMGYFIVMAEPAVYVLMKQVEEITDGAVSGKALRNGLCIGVSMSAGLSMLRVITGLSVLWFLVPGYFIAVILSFFTPKIFTAIAFDSGGVASGPMTATFLLPFAAGACSAAGGNIATDAFGVVAMVAMTPLITIQILGVAYKIRSRRAPSSVRTDAVNGPIIIEL